MLSNYVNKRTFDEGGTRFVSREFISYAEMKDICARALEEKNNNNKMLEEFCECVHRVSRTIYGKVFDRRLNDEVFHDILIHCYNYLHLIVRCPCPAHYIGKIIKTLTWRNDALTKRRWFLFEKYAERQLYDSGVKAVRLTSFDNDDRFRNGEDQS